MKALYPQHVAVVAHRTEKALAECGFDALLIHSGIPFTYFEDDQDAPFHSTPHFAHWTPLEGSYHLLLIRAGIKPLLVRVKPDDYWYEQLPLDNPFWLGEFEFREVTSHDVAWKELEDFIAKNNVAFIGEAGEVAEMKGIARQAINPPALVARLNWNRSFKTEYEVGCIEEAQKIAALGHQAARDAFLSGMSELEIHRRYVSSLGCADHDLPYMSIVALDEKSATLHYQGKRNSGKGTTFLLDSGAKHLGYCSDITRTWTLPECDPVFKALVTGVDRLQLEICALIVPGLPFPEVHRRAHVKVGNLLHELGIFSMSGEDAAALGLTIPFFPHGLGHFLGIQVHDVSGDRSRDGEVLASPETYPHLRMRRIIETSQVFTIEPGVYFIDMLLKPFRTGTHAEQFDWELIDRLLPLGGVRIEDNVLVTNDGHRNLTRPYI
jgi:Xaa-Pro dipeptidase